MKKDLVFKNSRLQQLIVDDRHSILRHGVLLLLMLIVIFFSNWQYEYSGEFKYYRLLCVYLGLIVMCYLNMFVLVPLLFFTGRYLLYLILLSLVVLLCGIGMSIALDTLLVSAPVTKNYFSHTGTRKFYDAFIVLVPITLMTTMIKLFQRWTRDNERIAELNNITLSMELNELKNQINPHFLFNMLNGIKALVRTDPDQATHVIMKLSDFLRYQIYENNGEMTLLRSELTFLSNFLSLEMIRRDRLSIQMDFTDLERSLKGLYVPPNLFSTFIENAVKHSVDINGNGSYINMEFSLSGNQLQFHCINSKDPDFKIADKKNSGFGLVNIKRRLDLIYQKNYSIMINNDENRFDVTLTIPL